MDVEVSLEEVQALSKEELDGIIKDYFDKKAWAKMTKDEKELHRQEFVVFVTNPVTEGTVPKFLRDYQERTQNIPNKDNKPGNSSSNEIDDDKENQPSCSYQTGQTSNEKKNHKRRTEVNAFDLKDPDRFPLKKYPKRDSAGIIDYFEEDEPPDDRYIFCDKCQEDVVDYCNKCGMLECIEDIKVPLGMPERAILTAPKMVVIDSSKIHGLGAFAVTEIPQGLRFGPYQGRVTKKQNESGKGYSWKLKRGKLVDAADEKFSNWMRYVNCARNSREQNLVAFQYQGELYYRTARVIPKGEELLVFYGKDYCLKLGIDLKKFFIIEKDGECEQSREGANKVLKSVITKEILKLKDVENNIEENLGQVFVSPDEEKYFFCKFCKICLTSEDYQKIHEKRCKFGKKNVEITETFSCNICSLIFTIERDRDIHENRCKKGKRQEKIDNNCKNREYKCNDCEKEYTSKSGLTNHIKGVHGKGNVKVHKCEQCAYHTMNKGSFNQHLKIHTSFGFVCICCQKSFKQKVHLDNHYVSKHKDQIDSWRNTITHKINQCPKCPYMAVKTSGFKNHLLTHEEGPKRFQYQCGICEFKSITKSNFKKHLNLHTDRLGFMCNLCNKKFNQKTELDGHILTQHSDNRQMMQSVTSKIHRCSSCSYKTVVISHFKQHIFSNHRDNQKLMQTIASKILKCNNCSYQTVKPGYMKQHSKKCQIKPEQ